MKMLKNGWAFLLYGTICILEIALIGNVDFNEYISLYLLEYHTLDFPVVFRYLQWFLPICVVVFYSSVLFDSFMGNNYIYFAIRGKQTVLFKIIIKKIAISFGIFFLIRLVVGFGMLGIYPKALEEWLFYLQTFVFQGMLVFMYITLKLIINNDQLMNIWIGFLLCMGALLIQWNPNVIWYEVFLQQTYLPACFIIMCLIIILLGVISIKLLEKRKG